MRAPCVAGLVAEPLDAACRVARVELEVRRVRDGEHVTARRGRARDETVELDGEAPSAVERHPRLHTMRIPSADEENGRKQTHL